MPVGKGFQKTSPRGIQNPVKHLRWSSLQQQITIKSRKIFRKSGLSLLFDRVLNPTLSANIYLFKVNNKNNGKGWDMLSHQSDIKDVVLVS